MGKSLKGKNLGEGLTQRKDGMYIGRFTDRWQKRRTVSAKTLSECKKKLAQAIEDDKACRNVLDANITVDQWFEKWIMLYKQNCRANTIDTYTRHYYRIRDKVGFVKLNQLTSIMVQDALNGLRTDNERRNSKKILSEMLEKAYTSDLVLKNVCKSVTTKTVEKDADGTIIQEKEKEIKTLSKEEENLFLKFALTKFYYNLFIVALQTGMRIGELTGLFWSDIDFDNRIIHVRRSLTYFSKNGKYTFELHPTKTKSGTRDIPMTPTCLFALKSQRVVLEELKAKGKTPREGYEDLVFVTRNYQPSQEFLVVECIQGIVKQINKNTDFHMDFFAPHTFRHTFATNALDSGMRPKTLQKILGHKTLQMTMDTYCTVPESTISNEMKMFEKAHSISLVV